jgi:hypothetical protein
MIIEMYIGEGGIKMERNILVIGNGFDIYHGLKTKYFDFVQYTSKVKSEETKAEENICELCKSNMFIKYFQDAAKANQGWIDCELEIEMISNIFEKLINVDTSLDKGGLLNQNILFDYEMKVLTYAAKYIENYYGKLKISFKYEHKFKRLNKDLMLCHLNKDLDDLIEVFYYYLKNEVNKKVINLRSGQIKNIEFSYVVNFNYTNTFELYNISPNDVCYIHGSVMQGANSMVLGTRDIEERNLDFIYFRKYFQRIQKRTGTLDENKFIPRHGSTRLILDPPNTAVNVHFFGLSLSDTDGDMIKKIESLSKKMFIYYYDQKDYEQKVINLIDVFGKVKALELINDSKAEFIKLETAEEVD